MRSGVAPDHPEVKSVENDFRVVADDPRFRFIGNASVGTTIPVETLRKNYAGVVLATGAQSRRQLKIPGSDLTGVMDARTFVDWYNGSPGFTALPGSFEERLPSVDTAVIIGNGNVALDCARMLVKQPSDLAQTDIAQHALDVLSRCSIKHVHVVGRRGTVQAAFTIKELRELMQLQGVTTVLHPDEVARGMTPASQAELAESRPRKRQDKLLRSMPSAEGAPQDTKHVHLRFCQGPVACGGDDAASVSSLRLQSMQLQGGAGGQKASAGGGEQTLECQLVLSSIGYSSTMIPGVPFDAERGVVPSFRARVVQGGAALQGLYVTGWLRRGPSGIIGTNIVDAKETVAAVMEDVRQGACGEGVRGGLEAVLDGMTAQGSRFVTWQGAKAILSAEEARGGAVGKPREKLTDVASMLGVAEECQGGVWDTRH